MADKDGRTEGREGYFDDRAGTEDARFHVVPHGDNEWAVKKEGIDEPEFTTDSKNEAVEEAKKLAKDAETMAYIHNDEGRIETQHNYRSEG